MRGNLKSGTNSLIQEYSAGGIVFFGSLVLVLKNQRGDYVFPKGHVEEGETIEATALREVEEEAGITPRLLGPLGTTEYKFFGNYDKSWRTKRVTWFLMEAADDTVRGDGVEIESGSFVSVSEAQRLLTYELDREKLKIAVQDLKQYRQ